MAVVSLALLITACGHTSPATEGASAPIATTGSASSSPTAAVVSDVDGIVTVGLATPYTPTIQGTANDDYRCFLLDTGVPEDRFITGVRFLPGNPEVVHHAILYRVQPTQIKAARDRDAQDEGDGWSCFGGPDLPPVQADNAVSSLDAAPWLAAWAPGGRESRYPDGTGVFLPADSSVILQVHYNLLAGDDPDATSVRLRTVPGSADLVPLETMLLPAPVELPCRPDEAGALCDRDAAVADTIARFGGESLRTIWGLQFLCGGDLVEPKSGPTQSCTHPVQNDLTVYAAAGHMHLLGRRITIVANAGTDRETTLLSIDNWNFDDQGSIPLPKPVNLSKGDSLTVTCTHDTALRQKLPALRDTEPRYITWGEGTTDEMCLGILTVAGRKAP